MAAPKTQPTDADVNAFLADVAPPLRRTDGQRLAEIFREVTGAEAVLWGPSIIGFGRYRIVSAKGVESWWPKTGFSPRRSALSLYGLKDRSAGALLLPNLGEYSEGAGCVYVKRLDSVDEVVLRRLISIAFDREDEE